MPYYVTAFGPLPLRLMLAAGFLFHGLPKLTPDGHRRMAGMLSGLGFAPPEIWAWVVGVVEVVGALMLLVGYRVRLAAVPLIVNMLVAMVTVHWSAGFGFINMTGATPGGRPVYGLPGIEVNLLYLAMLVSLILTGAGRWSLDERDVYVPEIPREPGLRTGVKTGRPPTAPPPVPR